jgi:hypothetical protein
MPPLVVLPDRGANRVKAVGGRRKTENRYLSKQSFDVPIQTIGMAGGHFKDGTIP